MILQPIVDLAIICAKKGIRNAVLSPGSRCAPITLAFVRHPEFHTRTISDERSAAFIALGMAQQLEKPVVLICTSGSAALNYYPAVAEAYFQQIPLIVITADRPPEWIDQWDGQTIRQQNLYGGHVKQSFSFPDDLGHPDKLWHSHRMVNEAINLANQFPPGPVHINIPLREPFYPDKQEAFDYSKKIQVVDQVNPTMGWSENEILKQQADLLNYEKILIVAGQMRPDAKIQHLLDNLSSLGKAVVVTDTISNSQSESTICFHDHFLGNKEISNLNPDLIISFGKSIISKNLKLFLRNSEASHWHIQPGGYVPDTFKKLSKHIQGNPRDVLEFLLENINTADPEFVSNWFDINQVIKSHLYKIIKNAPYGEYKAIAACLAAIPPNGKIHLANSMAVRYANFLGKRSQEIICNRGTSGIDGSVSTAVGCTFTTKDPVILITGDMAFFYDRNAFWHNYSMANLRIIILNNHAGGIFRLIEGPANQPELEEYFETIQALQANHLASEYGFAYTSATNEEELNEALSTFFQQSIHPKILEIKSASEKNARILSEVKSKIDQVQIPEK